MGYTRTGFELIINTKAEKVEESDIFGLQLLELINRGVNASVVFTCKVYDRTTNLAAFWPWAAFGQIYTATAPIGRLGTSVAQPLVLTVVAATPAATTNATTGGPATLTAQKAILSPDANLSLLFDSRVREVPLRMDLLPVDSASTGSLATGTLFTVS